tara:strand:- start:232 stop:474 length:243 start_codon:yes stop_codon:yes gene_type:complete
MATIIDRMKLENMLGKINTHNANVVHGWILFQDAVSALRTLDEVLLHLGTEGRVHPISHNGGFVPVSAAGGWGSVRNVSH